MEVIKEIYKTYNKKYAFILAKKTSQILKNIPTMPISTLIQKDIDNGNDQNFMCYPLAYIFPMAFDLIIMIVIPLLVVFAALLDILIAMIIIIFSPIWLFVASIIIVTFLVFASIFLALFQVGKHFLLNL